MPISAACVIVVAGTLATPDTKALQQSYPGVAVSTHAERVSRIYGQPFARGDTARDSAESFRTRHAGVLGVEPADIVAVGPGPDGRHVQPIMYDRGTGDYRFTGFFYTQQRDGVPVFGTALKLIVRNEPGFPLVLAAADLRELGGFRVDAQAAAAPPATAAAVAHATALAFAPGAAGVLSTRKVIWAGTTDDVGVPPRLADETLVDVGGDKWLVVTDAVTGVVLHQEHRIYTVDLVGTAEGIATPGVGAEQCEVEETMPMVHLVVEVFGGGTAVTDENGAFVIADGGAGPVDVFASLNGRWFDVDNAQGANAFDSVTVTPPGPASLLFNAANTEHVRAEVNAFIYANRIRDFVLASNPAYPTLDAEAFPVTVNRDDFICPANAWYDPAGGGSINFCESQGGSPNTAWSSIIYHEYGHHLVQAGGSGQCEYGEGMGDTMSVLILDDPDVGVGFFGGCATPLRTADDDCQYSETSCTTNCGGPCHSCGSLLASSVWSTRNELVVTHPDDYTEILAGLMVNSILVHVGTAITPDIAIDLLVLDDDDADLCNGTPHAAEIVAGFGAHGLVDDTVIFALPDGLPAVIDPAGGTTIRVSTCGPTPAAPGTVSLMVYVPDLGAWFNIPATEVQPGIHEAAFPAHDCGEPVLFFFAAETPSGQQARFPATAPSDQFVTMSAASVETVLADDFEADQGWTVSGSAVAGAWERGVPIPDWQCDAGNATVDGDGSGQCYLTDNSAAPCPSDVDGGSVVLTSPVMDVTGGVPALTYMRWFHNTGAGISSDHFEVDLSDDGGATWTNAETFGTSGFPSTATWTRRAIRIPEFVTATDQFRVRFVVSDADPDSTVESAVDGVQVLLASCGPGDLDGDGLVGITDFLMLLAAWGPCEMPCPPSCVADLDDDCGVGINDMLLLLANWSA